MTVEEILLRGFHFKSLDDSEIHLALHCLERVEGDALERERVEHEQRTPDEQEVIEEDEWDVHEFLERVVDVHQFEEVLFLSLHDDVLVVFGQLVRINHFKIACL